jgi:hypothetical protein
MKFRSTLKVKFEDEGEFEDENDFRNEERGRMDARSVQLGFF